MNEFALRAVAVVACIGALPSCTGDPDYCIEDELGGVQATGTVVVTHHSSVSGDESASFENVRVISEGSSVRMLACSRSGGDLWRLDAQIRGLDEVAIDATIAVSSDPNSPPPVFEGWLLQCPDGECDRKRTLVSPSSTGTGTAHQFSPSGHLDASVTANFSGLTSTTDVLINLSW